MKLKILFFPLMLIACVSVFIGYIWPEIQNIMALKAENEKAVQELALIENKKAIVRSLDQELGKNSDKEVLVKKYLAENKNEERVIDAVNFLATGAGVSLVDISISGGEGDTAENDDVIPASSRIFNSGQESEAEMPGESAQTETQVKLKKMPMKISVAGKYENIKGFLAGLNKLELMNEIKSTDISAQQESGETEEGTEAPKSDILSAEIETDFYYLNNVKAQNSYNLEVLGSENFDFSQVDKIKQFVSKGASNLEVGERGKSNPFFPL